MTASVKRSSEKLRVGTRPSRLAVLQAQTVVNGLRRFLPDTEFTMAMMASPGDRDRSTDLRRSPPDFFTRDLDEAVLRGDLDFAVHSAKDLPSPSPAGIDWCWLPWREDARDAIVLRRGVSVSLLPPTPRIGISSERREVWCRRRFPHAVLAPIRGNVEERMKQLDDGKYDMLVVAAAALNRLELADRITELIPLDELAPADGQGVLALTFRAGDPLLLRLRSLFVKAAVFVGAGSASPDSITLAGLKALQRCEVCIHDALLAPALLEHCPAGAERVEAGKRCGRHALSQEAINALLTDRVRKGFRVVRLKGGDPGIFGRLAEEVEALETLALPYRVIPGVSSLNAATTGTGLLLTRRGVSRGFCVMTPREQGGGTGAVSAAERAKLPMVFFMASGIVRETAEELMKDGMPPDTPAAMVIDAGGDEETLMRSTLGAIGAAAAARTAREGRTGDAAPEAPGLLIVGEPARFAFSRANGALEGRRILLTCSDALQEAAAGWVEDYGGRPVRFPLIRLTPEPEAAAWMEKLEQYDWLVLTSPSAVGCFFDLLARSGRHRRLPRLLVCGPGTALELRKRYVVPEAEARMDFGAEGLRAVVKQAVRPGERVLRLRSDRAGTELGDSFRDAGARVDDAVLYRNTAIRRERLPPFDAAFFASTSAVDTFHDLFGIAALKDKIVLSIGRPTSEALKKTGVVPDVVAGEATVQGSLASLAEYCVRTALHDGGDS